MVIILKNKADEKQVQQLTSWLKSMNLDIHVSKGSHHTLLGLVGDTSNVDIDLLKSLDVVDTVKRIQEPYKNANRKFHEDDTIVDVGGVKIGGGNFQIIAGPCSVESREQIITVAKAIKASGATLLRGGAFKPRTSPYAFQGLHAEGIELLKEARRVTGLPIVTEIMDGSHLPLFEDVDMIQVGARNMQNFELLKELGHTNKVILLKRGLANTIKELLMSAEYIMAGGNPNVILCERGIRTFEKYTRNTLDLSVIPIVKQKTHLPIIIDPSHATGDWKLVEAMSLAAIAAGADGLIVEVHHDPVHAWSDGAQCLTPANYKTMIEKARAIAKVVGRDIY